jgi:hypothetical protein
MVWSPAAGRVLAQELVRVLVLEPVLELVLVLVLVREPELVLVREPELELVLVLVREPVLERLSVQARGPERQTQVRAPGLPFVWVLVRVLQRPLVPAQQLAPVIAVWARWSALRPVPVSPRWRPMRQPAMSLSGQSARTSLYRVQSSWWSPVRWWSEPGLQERRLCRASRTQECPAECRPRCLLLSVGPSREALRRTRRLPPQSQPTAPDVLDGPSRREESDVGSAIPSLADRHLVNRQRPVQACRPSGWSLLEVGRSLWPPPVSHPARSPAPRIGRVDCGAGRFALPVSGQSSAVLDLDGSAFDLRVELCFPFGNDIEELHFN